MNTNQYYDERGGIVVNITLVILLVAIGVLIYILAGGQPDQIGRNIGTDTPTVEYAPRAPRGMESATTSGGGFNDGLGRASASTEYPLDDVGAGLAVRDVFRYDINNDGKMDRITRSRVETGTSHFSYEYTIELNTDGGFVDITPPDFNTVEGAQCALQKIRFSFEPSFRAIKISRPWQDTWITPTPATRDTYSIRNGTINLIDRAQMASVCDVTELF